MIYEYSRTYAVRFVMLFHRRPRMSSRLGSGLDVIVDMNFFVCRSAVRISNEQFDRPSLWDDDGVMCAIKTSRGAAAASSPSIPSALFAPLACLSPLSRPEEEDGKEGRKEQGSDPYFFS